MPGILHTHLWGADNSSLPLLEMASWPALSCWSQQLLTGLGGACLPCPSSKGLGARNEVAFLIILEALRCDVNSVAGPPAQLQTSNQGGGLLAR